MNIICTTSSFSVLENLNEYFNIILNPFKRKLTEEETINLILQYQPIGIIAGLEPLTRRVLEKANTLRVISRCGVGLDSIDLAAAKEIGIAVTCTPEAPVNAVAELTLGLILGVSRHIPAADLSMRKGNWDRPRGMLLHGKTAGIIGCGRIGTKVSRLLLAFGCEVLGYDPYQENHEICKLVSLDNLLSNADIISLHIPYEEIGQTLIGKREIAMMKKGAILINTARGGLLDETSLYNYLANGHLAGAGLDCFEEEPYNGQLLKLKNVVLTPHIGSYAMETRGEMERQAVENLLLELKRLGVIL